MRVLLSLSCAVVLGLLAAACDSPAPLPNDGGSGGAGAAGAAGGTGGTGGSGGGEAPDPLVETNKGPVQGYVLDSTNVFLGIPFAAPPVGDLRWKPPQPHEGWTDTFVATKKAETCAQLVPVQGGFDDGSSEDCLTLNVWAPSKPESDALPVLVWIHGGAFVLGSGADSSYDGKIFSEATGTIVVTVNYRLGPFGFLALPELKSEDGSHPSSGNYGLEDQRAALRWVKDNIKSFGGDPDKITLFGESAGGISTCLHLVSPESKGLFDRAIIQSGPCDSTNSEEDAFEQAATFVENLGCSSAADKLACLRGKSTEEIATAIPATNDFLGSKTRWFPVLDGWNVPDRPTKLLADGAFEKVPTIVGSNADEGTLFVALANTMIPDDAAFQALADGLAPGKGAEVVAMYPSSKYGSAKAAATAALGDAGFVCPARRAARLISAAGVDAFLYHFTYPVPGALLGDLGAFHSGEIKFVFGNPGQLTPKAPNEDELPMSQAMQGYWSRHADQGSPNSPDALVWPKYELATDQNIVFDLMLSTQSGLKKDLCDFWDGIELDAI